ncbi:MAG: hypothetical protein ABW076_17125 [Candidatus Thiodiazotropha sp.]
MHRSETTNHPDRSRLDEVSNADTAWPPINPNNGQTYQNRRIRRISSTRWEIVPTLKAHMIYLYLTLFGLVIFFISLFTGASLLPLLFSFLISLTGLLLIYGESTPIVIDRQAGVVYRDPRLGILPGHKENRHTSHSIDSLRAIQVLREKECLCAGESQHPYFSYELNLVFLDGSRFNLMDHADFTKLNHDARLLARFLRLPLWVDDLSANAGS